MDARGPTQPVGGVKSCWMTFLNDHDPIAIIQRRESVGDDDDGHFNPEVLNASTLRPRILPEALEMMLRLPAGGVAADLGEGWIGIL